MLSFYNLEIGIHKKRENESLDFLKKDYRKINIFVFMIKIIILGGGNIANHLIQAFSKTTTVEIVQLYARNLKQITPFYPQFPITDDLNNLKEADIYILAVSDNAIGEVSSNIKTGKLVVHTSGCMPMGALQNNGEKGVFYLLQSFTKDKEVSFENIPFCLEATNDQNSRLLRSLALSIGKKVYFIDSEKRKYLHVAAVFANNFTNYMYTIANDICKEQEIPFEILHNIIGETARKIQDISPRKAQTGPAIRKDTKTIDNHVTLLNNKQQEIYKLLTESISNEKKL